jgi:hypothetical protein
MDVSHSDALVFFGATGDLAYKKIFPALHAMVKRGHLNVPVIGVARRGWNLDQFRKQAKNSLEKYGGVNPAAFDKLCTLLRYVSGDYNDPATFQALRKELGSARQPAYYLAIVRPGRGTTNQSWMRDSRSRHHRKASQIVGGRVRSTREFHPLVDGITRRWPTERMECRSNGVSARIITPVIQTSAQEMR